MMGLALLVVVVEAISVEQHNRRIFNLGQLQVFKFMFPRELPSRTAASIQVHVPHGLPSSIVLCSKKHKIELLHFFYVSLDALFRSGNLHILEQID